MPIYSNTTSNLLRPAIFFDRDGVVNVDDIYVYKIEDFIYVDGFIDVFKQCKKKGYLLFVITNQSGIGRGYYSLEDFLILSDFMQQDLRKKCGFGFDKIYFCAHKPSDNCDCRKPKDGMIRQAMKDFALDISKSYLIGDKISDIQAGINAKIGTKILFQSPNQQTDSMSSDIMQNTQNLKQDIKADIVIDSLYQLNSIIN